ncbi:type II secretion system protein [Vibrio misgurnus]|uniref:type II secretion system protein n=1 Tax=Vibrio misgurnus TaxID=2993714 RepID=UPI0023F7E715|nr:type II secretion system protein [Vibrio sp. VCS]
MTRHKAFTLIELLVVIILLGVLSAYAASSLIGAGSFAAFTAQEQAISIIRQIQVSRMQSNLADSELLANGHYVLAIRSDCLGSVAGCNGASSERRSDVLRAEQLSFTTQPSLINQSLAFDLLGNPQDPATPTSGVTITLRAPDSSAALCINAQGYIAKGACQ